jgi:hypothetical protein
MAKGKGGAATAAAWKGPEALRPFLVPLGSLAEDPGNARTHGGRSIPGIAASYARFGQQRPIVVDARGVVRAGNGQLAAAASLGWTHVAAVTSDLPDAELAAFALADNRTAELSQWDFEALAGHFKAFQSGGTPFDDLGWADFELEPLLAAEWAPAAVEPLDGHTRDAPPEPEAVAPHPHPHPDPQAAAHHSGDRPHAVFFGADAYDAVSEACDAYREAGDDPTPSEADVLEALCRAYMASPR